MGAPDLLQLEAPEPPTEAGALRQHQFAARSKLMAHARELRSLIYPPDEADG